MTQPSLLLSFPQFWEQTPLPALAANAYARLRDTLCLRMPGSAAPLLSWMDHLGEPTAYFLHPDAFPTLALPLFQERAMAGAEDPSLQADLCYSSMAGYYFIRLIDDVMDGPAGPRERALLPALAFLHTEFQRTYGKRFPAEDPFWCDFTRLWCLSADAALCDARVAELDLAGFRAISARKVAAAQIPLYAVARCHGHAGLPTPFRRVATLLGEWHQMYNDLFDWRRDLDAGTTTYFLSIAKQRRHGGESVVAWVAREGFAWAVDLLFTWLEPLCAAARATESQELCRYLDARAARLQKTANEVTEGLSALAKVLAAGSTT